MRADTRSIIPRLMGLRYCLIAGILTVSACSGSNNLDGEAANGRASKEAQSPVPLTLEQQVAQRAEARWQAVIRRDWESVYGYLSPGVRELQPLHTFIRNAGQGVLLWTDAQLREVSCEEQLCQLKFKLGYDYMGQIPEMRGQPMSTTANETWLHSEGDWWYAPAPN